MSTLGDTKLLGRDLPRTLATMQKAIRRLEQQITSPAFVSQVPSHIVLDSLYVGNQSFGGSNDLSNPPGDVVLTSGSTAAGAYLDISWSMPAANPQMDPDNPSVQLVDERGYPVYTDVSVASYEVLVAEQVSDPYGDVSYDTPITMSTIGNQTRIIGLKPNTIYGVRIAAVGPDGSVGTSEPQYGYTDKFVPPDTSIPADVAELTATAALGAVALAWADVADVDVANGAGLYLVEYATDEAFTAPVDVRVAGNYTVIVGLTTGVPYYFRSKAVDRSGNLSAEWSPVTTATPA